MIALAVGAKAHRYHVGTRPGFAHRKRTDMLARDELRQILVLLRRIAIAPYLIDAQVRVRTIGQPDGRGCAADFLHDDHVRKIAHRRAAEFFFDRDPEKAEVAHLAPEIGRKPIAVIYFGRARR